MAATTVKMAMEKTVERSSLRPGGGREIQNMARQLTARRNVSSK
jgi:hypothetical protein